MQSSKEWLLLLALWSLSASVVFAHGGGELYVINAPIGDYLVSVSTAPVPLEINAPVHVTVSIADGITQAPVLDGRVNVDLHDGAGTLLYSQPATTAQAVNKLFYETDFPGIPAGDYRIAVTIAGEDGQGTVDFWVEIAPTFPLNRLAWGLTAVLLTAFFFWYRTWRKNKPPRQTRPPRRRYTG